MSYSNTTFHEEFKKNLAFVTAEAESKVARFEDLNRQRLGVHFREAYERALNFY